MSSEFSPGPSPDREGEVALLEDADRRARSYVRDIGSRRVFPSDTDLAALRAFDEPLPQAGETAASTVRLLDEIGSAGAVESNGARYFGFVTGATLPVAAAADRLALAWDNSGSSSVGSPTTSTIEDVAARWLLEILDLPRSSAVGFTTSASSGTVIALSAARRSILAGLGWDVDRAGLAGAPEVRVVASELAHVVVVKALRLLGFGLDNVQWAPVDDHGRVDPSRLPPLDGSTILILQAGEVNTGEFDPFAELLDRAQDAGAWVHVDGAFGLWARASRHHALTAGVDRADSWSVDGHKWLNTPYDSAMVIVRDEAALVGAMRSDAVYLAPSVDAQRNRTLDFSRRGRGIPVWAALRTLGRAGVADLVERTMHLAAYAADGLRGAGYDVLNRVTLNQVLVAADDPERTRRIVHAAQQTGDTWFGETTWQGRAAFRISVSSWRTTEADIDALVALLRSLRYAT
jgi:glutamate/tyrosine decarboxylase-like PLP-dependent enzyme